MCAGHYKKWIKGSRGESLVKPVSGVPVDLPECSIDGCSRDVRRHGLCDAHYRRWLNGDRDDLLTRPINSKAKDWPPKKKRSIAVPKSAREERTDYGLSPDDKVNLLISMMGDKCLMCGKSYPARVYDFHHRDPIQKKFPVKGKARSNGLTDEVITEARKCDLLCVNCHRSVHDCFSFSLPDLPDVDTIYEICKVDGCDRLAITKSYCNAHYIRHLRGKDIHGHIRKTRNENCQIPGCKKNPLHGGARGFCSNHYKQFMRRQTWEKIIALKGGKCKRCNESFDVCAYDLHHLDPSAKEFTIGIGMSRYSAKRLLGEASKCELLCANCHRLVHFVPHNEAGLIELLN